MEETKRKGGGRAPQVEGKASQKEGNQVFGLKEFLPIKIL